LQIHNVYFWLKEGLEASDIQSFEDGLTSLTHDERVITGYFGKPATTENRDVVDSTYHHGLVLSFDNVAAHNQYQAGKAHQAFVDDHGQKFDRVQVYDIQT
jgi:hypothetical protein